MMVVVIGTVGGVEMEMEERVQEVESVVPVSRVEWGYVEASGECPGVGVSRFGRVGEGGGCREDVGVSVRLCVSVWT